MAACQRLSLFLLNCLLIHVATRVEFCIALVSAVRSLTNPPHKLWKRQSFPFDACRDRTDLLDLMPPCYGDCRSTSSLKMLSGNNQMEVGIQTAQLLMNSKRRDQLKKKMQSQFPLVPKSVLDSSIDVTAQAFDRVAPEKLKIALRRDGMDRLRPDIEQIIVEFALDQPFIKQTPVLDPKDKRKIVEAIVSTALDYILRDAQELLTAPEVRLEILEEKVREVKAMMGPYRLLRYQARHKTREITLVGALSLAVVLVYLQRNVPMQAQILSTITKASTTASNQLTIAATRSWAWLCLFSKQASTYLMAMQDKLLIR